MILAAERCGAWNEALSLYERSLQQPEPSYHGACNRKSGLSTTALGHLNCLLRMGHLDAVLTQVFERATRSHTRTTLSKASIFSFKVFAHF